MLGWNEVVLELLELNGKPVCVTVGEIGGAGAEVAVFSGTLRVGEPEHPATEDEVFALWIGGHGTVVLDRALFNGARNDGALNVTQATVYFVFEAATRFRLDWAP